MLPLALAFAAAALAAFLVFFRGLRLDVSTSLFATVVTTLGLALLVSGAVYVGALF
ncbi:MAG: hypothetical protein KIT25_09725 [Enhydrobacter sp.]|nr:MAG: hypothetical protein KIT25_09725 [Enhydrobacter sp.]